MKPSIPQGTRDYSPDVVRKRRFILDILRNIFELYGFQPLETPAMENLSTLTGKYGEEGDRLIFKILNNGLHDPKKDKEKLRSDWERILERSVALPSVTERALRYDLTIPFARYVAMNQGQLALPFRRYQMQPVWRADRPQRGRYREFWQCDCDVVGSTSLINEAELIAIYRAAFHRFSIPGVTVRINSRKLLAALAEVAGHADHLTSITIALDKLEKIGWEGVAAELSNRGIGADGVAVIQGVITATGTNVEKLHLLEERLGEAGAAGIEELRSTLRYHGSLSVTDWSSELMVDISLARGLDYYTGIIVEVGTNAVEIGSLGGGGRYDDLTGLFGVKGLSGVGISFGIDRIYDVLEELQLFPETASTSTRALVINFGGEAEAYALNVLKTLRWSGIRAEIYPDAAKADKQFKYAGKRGIPYVVLAGEDEMVKSVVSVKNMETGEQQECSVQEAVSLVF